MSVIYKRLGDYIIDVDERNRDHSIQLSQGINNNKYFQEPRQVADNSANDKIVRRGQFAYNRATTRNGDKISIAYREGDDCTVSSAYQVFYIKDEEQLNPHYLLLWFKRPAFDRYARFKSHGSAHEFFEWDEMCNVMLPVPSIEEQRRIVALYQAVENRIRHNEQLIARLEDTAHAFFYENYARFLNDEILPNHLEKTLIGNIVECNTSNLSNKDNFTEIEYYDTSSVTDNCFNLPVLLSGSFPSRAKRKVVYNDILYSTVRPNLHHYGLIKNVKKNTIVSTGFLVIRSILEKVPNEFIYTWLTKYADYEIILQGIAEHSKATYPSINAEDVLNLEIVVPKYDMVPHLFTDLYNYIYRLNCENVKLRDLQSLVINNL